MDGAFLLQSQISVISMILAVLVLSGILAYFMTANYVRDRSRSTLFWSFGLWLFVAGIVEEAFFASGVYSPLLIRSYLFIVAVLVEFLAIGSMQLIPSRISRNSYYIFSAIASAILLYALLASSIGNIITTYVVFGALPLIVTMSSVIVTFPAAIILVVTAAIAYRKTSSLKMLSIIAGVFVVSAAGTLYIVSFPAFLYISEFIGILLLWLGFYTFRKPLASAKPAGV